MRIYSSSTEETLRARKLLADWAGENLISKAQYLRLEQDTRSDLRTTNVFLRLVLFLFTVIGIGALAALFFRVLLLGPSTRTKGVFLIIYAGVCYAAAEVAGSRGRLYRYGIEEALAVCSVALLALECSSLFSAVGFIRPGPADSSPSSPPPALSFPCGSGAGSDFGMHFSRRWPSLSFCRATGRRLARHSMNRRGAVCSRADVRQAVRSRHRYDYLDGAYSLAEAFLWLGIYLAVNLQLSVLTLRDRYFGDSGAASQFPTAFYWMTWVLIWGLPPVVLARGIGRRTASLRRRRDSAHPDFRDQ